MNDDEKIKLSIKYSMKMKSLQQEKKVAQRIANALYSCDATPDDLKGAKLLLEVLIGE